MVLIKIVLAGKPVFTEARSIVGAPGSERGSTWRIATGILRRAGPFGYSILARHQRVRGVTPTRLTLRPVAQKAKLPFTPKPTSSNSFMRRFRRIIYFRQ